MRIKETKIYKFDELSDEAKEKAREWWRRCQDGDNFWSECTLEEAANQGRLMGIRFAERARHNQKGVPLPGEPKIYWSGFSSQGDGACFEGTWRACDVEATKVAEDWGDSPATKEIKRIAGVFGEIAKQYPSAYFCVSHSGHYYHEHSTHFDVDMLGDETPEPTSDSEIATLTQDEEALTENARDFMRWIYSQLEHEHDYFNSDESVDENITANEYEFEEDGSRA